MKKILALLLALVMVLGLVACASSEKPAETPTTEEPAATEEPTTEEPAAEEPAAEEPAEISYIGAISCSFAFCLRAQRKKRLCYFN